MLPNPTYIKGTHGSLMIPPLRQTYGKFHQRWNDGAAKDSTCVLDLSLFSLPLIIKLRVLLLTII